MLKRIGVLIVSVALLSSLYGCVAILAGAVGGVGTAAWLHGKLSEDVSASYAKTVDATKAALKSLDMELTKEVKKDEVTQIMSKYTDGATTWIDIRPISAKRTKIEVRIGATGNKDGSRRIIDEIKKNL